MTIPKTTFFPTSIPGSIAANPLFHANPPAACDLCQKPITTGFFDAYIPSAGKWGNVCGVCVVDHGVKLGTGRGQRYEKQADGRFLKVEG